MPSIDVDVYAWNGAAPSTTCFDGTLVQFIRNGNVEKQVTTSCADDPQATTQLVGGATYTCTATNSGKSNPPGQTFTPSSSNTRVDCYLT